MASFGFARGFLAARPGSIGPRPQARALAQSTWADVGPGVAAAGLPALPGTTILRAPELPADLLPRPGYLVQSSLAKPAGSARRVLRMEVSRRGRRRPGRPRSPLVPDRGSPRPQPGASPRTSVARPVARPLHWDR